MTILGEHVTAAAQKACLDVLSARQICRTVEEKVNLPRDTLADVHWKREIKTEIDKVLTKIKDRDGFPEDEEQNNGLAGEFLDGQELLGDKPLCSQQSPIPRLPNELQVSCFPMSVSECTLDRN